MEGELLGLVIAVASITVALAGVSFQLSRIADSLVLKNSRENPDA